MDELKKFSIDDIKEVKTEDSVEFAIARIAVLSTRPNSHGINITEEILRRDGQSVLGKWVVAKYNKWINDTTTHLPSETIVGIVPKDANLTFEETDDGFLVMYVDAIISKIYATEVYKLFIKDNFRNVSVEMGTSNDTELEDGTIDIDGLCIYGITILGRTVKGSCPDANMKIVQFSEQQANDFYDKAFAFNKIKDMANDLIQFADNQLKLKELETTSKEDNMEENKNLSEQPKDENEDIIMEEVKEFPKDKEKDDSVEEMSDTKTEEMSEETMGCDGEGKEMSEKKFAIDLDGLWGKIYDILEAKYPNEEVEYTESIYRIYGIYEEDGQKFVVLKKRADDTTYKANIIIEDEKITLSDELVEIKIETRFVPIEQVREFAEDDYKEFAEKLFSCELKEIVEQVVELKKFMDTTIKTNTEKRFSEIMVEPKLCLGEKAYNVLFEEGKTLSLNELDAFEAKVKAFCEDAPKKQEEASDNELMKFACGEDTNNNVEQNLDVWSRIANY